MGAEEDVGNVPAACSDGALQPPMYVYKSFQSHQPAVDRRLVRYDNGGKAGSGEALQSLEASRQKHEFIPVFNISGRISVDNAVAIQEYNLVWCR